ncbi:hypothetical protein Vadar_026251 [Vaccinium darrowii]|uniref:Uncharacterized protein n=1 Tax=Vaccinium darrowii TaxID=229202 RepID=A0ACB7X4F0_9ERIC|nr:hypothetical protein Vadar_026251 [Vaccinium darrowii]
MDDDGGNDNLQQTMEFTSEDFSELNDIINLTTTNSVEEILELYKSFNSTNDYGGNIENQMPKVQKVESTGLKSLLNEEFSTRQELLDRVRSTALMEGYVTVIKSSKGDRKVVIGCDRGGKFRGTSVPLDERKKISATRLISCSFEMVGLKRVEYMTPAMAVRICSFMGGVTAVDRGTSPLENLEYVRVSWISQSFNHSSLEHRGVKLVELDCTVGLERINTARGTSVWVRGSLITDGPQSPGSKNGRDKGNPNLTVAIETQGPEEGDDDEGVGSSYTKKTRLDRHILLFTEPDPYSYLAPTEFTNLGNSQGITTPSTVLQSTRFPCCGH